MNEKQIAWIVADFANEYVSINKHKQVIRPYVDEETGLHCTELFNPYAADIVLRCMDELHKQGYNETH